MTYHPVRITAAVSQATIGDFTHMVIFARPGVFRLLATVWFQSAELFPDLENDVPRKPNLRG